MTEKYNMSPIIENQDSELLIKLDKYPVTEIYQKYNTNNFPFETYYDQELRFCSKSNHAFLNKQLPQDFIYNAENYNTVSSSSVGSVTALDNFYSFIMSKIKDNFDSIIDIGANDTMLLKKFLDKKKLLIGIDPNINSDDKNIKCIKDYLENVDLNSLSKGNKVFLSSHTLEHIYDPKKFMEILSSASSEQDEFFFQFPCLDLLIRDSRFDQIHHQHLHLFSIQSFSIMIANFGYEILNYELDPDHYGTLMVHFRKTEKQIENYEYEKGFFTVAQMKKRYDYFLEDISLVNERILQDDCDLYCYGASLMLPIIPYYIPAMKKALAIIDQDKSKIGLSYVNFDVEIKDSSNIDFSKSNVLVTALATKFATRKIVSKLSELKTMNIILPLNTI
tara:strand:+ start:405 stop:1577 length:1173 start_codon:yes stop_codon:yes gene_type:complete